MDQCTGRGRDVADVDALAAVDGDELVVVAVAERNDGVERELLVGGAVAGVLDDGGAVGGGRSRDVQAFAAELVDNRVGVALPLTGLRSNICW